MFDKELSDPTVKHPPSLTNSSDNAISLTVNSVITEITFSFSGSDLAASSCIISPTLPTGLVFSYVPGESLICSINGTPSAIATDTVYTVTAISSYGSSSVNVSIEVTP